VTRTKLSATDVRNLQTLLLASVFEPGAIGGRIKQAREEAGLTQEDLADAIDVTTRTVQNYESGDTKPYKKIGPIADATGVSTRWLLHGEADEDQASLSQMAGELAEIREMLSRVLESRSEPGEQAPGREAEDL
jgi:transcriptional regulator with XRE-family HTH domain